MHVPIWWGNGVSVPLSSVRCWPFQRWIWEGSVPHVCFQKEAAPTGCCRRDLCSAMKRCFLSSSLGLLVANYRRLIPTLQLLWDGSPTANSSTSLQALFWNGLHLLDCVPVPAYFPCLTFIYSIPLWGLLLLASWHAQETAYYNFLPSSPCPAGFSPRWNWQRIIS